MQRHRARTPPSRRYSDRKTTQEPRRSRSRSPNRFTKEEDPIELIRRATALLTAPRKTSTCERELSARVEELSTANASLRTSNLDIKSLLASARKAKVDQDTQVLELQEHLNLVTAELAAVKRRYTEAADAATTAASAAAADAAIAAASADERIQDLNSRCNKLLSDLAASKDHTQSVCKALAESHRELRALRNKKDQPDCERYNFYKQEGLKYRAACKDLQDSQDRYSHLLASYKADAKLGFDVLVYPEVYSLAPSGSGGWCFGCGPPPLTDGAAAAARDRELIYSDPALVGLYRKADPDSECDDVEIIDL